MEIKKIIIAICGASGSIYGLRLLKTLLEKPVEIHLIISEAGELVLRHETSYKGQPFDIFLKKKYDFVFHEKAELKIYKNNELAAPFASGSFKHNGMVIAPCSMNTPASIAAGTANNLINRSADVCLKEKRALILLARETPLSLIHLKNMYKVALAGGVVMPPCPGFYSKPQNIHELVDSLVARVLDHLNIEHDFRRWGDSV